MSPKLIIKKNLIIFKKKEQWEEIWHRLLSEYGSKLNISWVLKRELGFTIRTHTEWIEYARKEGKPKYYAELHTHLDFYNESMQSWFMLRYLNSSTGADTQII